MKMSRKEFLAGVAGVAAVGLLVPSCGPDENSGGDGGNGGGGDGGTDGGPGDNTNCANPAISANHGHRLTVPRADVEAGEEKTYDITGTATHPHSLTLTASHFTTLAAGESVTVPSTNEEGHTHSVTVSCP